MPRFRFALLLVIALLAGARPAAAQDWIFQRLNLDKLQVQSLGVEYGKILPSQLVAANVVGVHAEYGNFSPNWRLVFGMSYWESKFEDDVVQAFADSLHKSLANPSDSVKVSPIRLYDVTFSAEARWMPQYSGVFKPFVGGGIAAHVINAEGALIKGTFVERSLDDIAGGMFVDGGAQVKLFPHFGVQALVRADLLSGFRSTQARVGATYYFGRIRGTPADSSVQGQR